MTYIFTCKASISLKMVQHSCFKSKMGCYKYITPVSRQYWPRGWRTKKELALTCLWQTPSVDLQEGHTQGLPRRAQSSAVSWCVPAAYWSSWKSSSLPTPTGGKIGWSPQSGFTGPIKFQGIGRGVGVRANRTRNAGRCHTLIWIYPNFPRIML